MTLKILQKKWVLFFLFLISFSISAQIKGVVKDSLSGAPIPFVNIWIQNENIGASSEENGEFTINASRDKTLIFSALGFEKKTIKASQANVVYLKETSYKLEEVLISNRFETKEIQIGKTENTVCQAFDNGPKIDTKFFPYFPSYKKTRFIKKVSIYTDCRIEEATVKLHFYSVDENGFPDKEMLSKDLIVKVKKGTRIHTIDVSRFNLTFPKNGIFVGFEKLLIESNKLEKTIADQNTNTTTTTTTYFPYMLYNYVERDFLFTYSGGKWHKQLNNPEDGSTLKKKIFEPSMQLTLTN